MENEDRSRQKQLVVNMLYHEVHHEMTQVSIKALHGLYKLQMWSPPVMRPE